MKTDMEKGLTTKVKKLVKDHEGKRPYSSFKPACSNTYYAHKGTGTLYGLVGK